MTERKLVGMVVPTVDNSFFANLAHYAESYLSEKGYQMMICNSANNAENEKAYLKTLVEIGVKGILCVSGLSALEKDLIPDGFPLIWMDRHPESERKIPWVANDDREAMGAATAYLLEKGCKHILLMPGYLAENRTSPRVVGYEDALRKNGIEPDPSYILNRSGKKPSEAETEEMVREVMRKGMPVDAIITSSDRAAFGVITALHSVGLYVPEDVKLISFDNSPYSTMASPAITAIDRNPGQLAQKACEVLLKLIAGEQPEHLETIVPVSLEKRDSTR